MRVRIALVLASILLVVGFLCRPRHNSPTIAPQRISVSNHTSGNVIAIPAPSGGLSDAPSSVVLVNPSSPSRWKGVALSTPSGFDAGLGYEALRVKVDKEITVPVTGWKVGHVELPELTGDLVLTPERAGVGAGVALTEHMDLEAGVSKRLDNGAQESYVGVGWHFAF